MAYGVIVAYGCAALRQIVGRRFCFETRLRFCLRFHLLSYKTSPFVIAADIHHRRKQ